MTRRTSAASEVRAVRRRRFTFCRHHCFVALVLAVWTPLAACSSGERGPEARRSSQGAGEKASDSTTSRLRTPSAPLELVQAGQVSVPDSVAFIDARIHASGSIVAWGSGRGVWLFRNGQWQQLGRNVSRAAGVRFTDGDSILEVVDRGRGAVVTVGVHGIYRTRYAFRPTHVVEAAATVGDGWYVIGSNVEGDFVGTRVWVNEQRTMSQVIWSRGTSAKVYSARVSGVEHDALIAEYNPPFRVQRLGSDNILRTLPSLPDTLLARLEGSTIVGSDTARWGALRVIPIRDGEFLQSFTDLRSDRRMLVLRDQAGRFDRAKLLTAPVSVLDVDVASQQVLGARRTSRTEFVIYKLSGPAGVGQLPQRPPKTGARPAQATAQR